jgi:prepilin-type N-terminal cleavage/methylation domain-containing protein
MANRGKCIVEGEGFTIIEVMIVLAITGLMFLIAALFIGGKQNHTEFSLGVSELQSSLQKNIDDVENGIFNEENPNTCTQSTAFTAEDDPIVVPPTIKYDPSGSSSGCIFLGSALQFDASNNPVDSTINVYPIVGNQDMQTDPLIVSQNLMQSYPILLSYQASAGQPMSFQQLSLEYGLEFACSKNSIAYYTSSTTTPPNPCSSGGSGIPIGAFGFATTTPLAPTSSPNLSGDDAASQVVSLIAFNNTGFNLTSDPNFTNESIAQINSDLATIPTDGSGVVIDPQGGITMCLMDGGTNQSALFDIGSSGQQLSVTVSIEPGLDCG